MLDKFNNSFYGIWFSSLPERVVEGAIREMENEFSHMRRACPALYDDYIVLSAAKFLLTYFDISGVDIEIDGEKVSLKSLAETGATAYVKKDSIDSNVSREYFQPSIPEGYTLSDFPLGRMNKRLEHIEMICNKAASFGLFKTGSNTRKNKKPMNGDCGAKCHGLGKRHIP